VSSKEEEAAAPALAVAASNNLPGRDAERPFQVTLTDFEQAMTVVVASTLRGASGFMYVQCDAWTASCCPVI
jgi:hypothetical protein